MIILTKSDNPEIPPHMKPFMLPHLTRQELLPDPSLSIKALTDFLLPSQQPKITKDSELRILSQFFSKDEPSILTGSVMTRLRHLPIPDSNTVQQLVKFSPQAWLDGFRSVHYAHLQSGTITCFLLWVITFWRYQENLWQVDHKPRLDQGAVKAEEEYRASGNGRTGNQHAQYLAVG